jgi:hypothetical protein
LASKEQGIGHFTKSEAQSERRRRENRGPVKYTRQSGRKRSVLGRVRRNGIRRTAEEIRFERETDYADDVIQSDPRDPLAARSDSTADAQAKRQGHPRESAPLFSKYHAEAQNGDSRAPFRRMSRFGFPVDSYLREETSSRWAGFR